MWRAPLPEGDTGQFGPGISAAILSLSHASGMSEPKIKDFLSTIGMRISAGEISNIPIKHREISHQERQDILPAGLGSTPYQNLDSTTTRVNGRI